MIKEIAHNTAPGSEATAFYNGVRDIVNRMQQSGLIVEIQYQQSDKAYSALILGRSENDKA